MRARILILFGLIAFLSACSADPHFDDGSLYESIGGKEKVAEIVDNFIIEIEHSPAIFPYFEHANVTRFREKLIEHLCMLTGGPCKYTGDSMERVHDGMQITEHDFNLGVDLFIRAMDKAQVPHTLQNKVIASMAPSRKHIIYR